MMQDPALSGTQPLASSTRPAPLGKKERIRRFGVDCGDGLEWAAGWEPGGEYTKTLTVKNVSTKVMKLKYKLPTSKFFSMAYPETINLTAGLSKSLQISFRPIRLEEYDDVVQFFTEKGSFVVPISAAIPRISSKVPEHLDFGFCPCAETGTKTFLVTNDGEVPISFSWTVVAPFSLSPRSGSIAAGSAATITVRFQPVDACVYVGYCVCTVPGHTTHTLKVGGIGKYPFVAATNETVDFSRVLTHTTETKHFKLMNKSLVYARWKIDRVAADCEAVYAFQPTSGIIPPDGETTLAVRYTPRVSGTFSHEAYKITTPGGNAVTVECRGESLGSEVELSRRVVNFNDVPIVLPRKTVGRVLELLNHTDLPVPYQLYQMETDGLFSLDNASGVLPPRLSSYVNLTFSPLEPGNYVRRVYVLLRNTAPMAVDLIGSGYTDKRRPAPILPKHISDYWEREHLASLGLHKLTPEEMGERAATKRAALAAKEAEYGGPLPESYIADDDTEKQLLVGTGYVHDPDAEQLLMRGLFRGGGWSGGAVTLEEEAVEFGAASRLSVGPTKTVRLFNHTNGKVSASWVCPAARGVTPCFVVSPPSVDILPHSSASFKVQFRPPDEQKYYCQVLECYVAFKSMRSFRLVGEDNFCPPWCLPLTASGHTFPSGIEQFIAKPTLSHSTLQFPAVHAGDVGYQTISIKNDGDTPMLFQVRNDATGVFTVRPSVGLVPKGTTQLLAVRFAPPDVNRYTRSVNLILNTDARRPVQLHMHGSGTKAGLLVGSNGRVHCATTCVGATSRSVLSLTNPSRLPLAFEWDVPQRLQSTVAVEPASGVLRGHERIELSWFFSPQRDGQLLAKLPLLVSALDDRPDGKTHPIARQSVQLSGVGSIGKLTAEPSRVDFGPVLVGTSERRHMTVLNPSDVALFYEITYMRLDDGRSLDERDGDGDDGEGDAPLLTLTPTEGVIPARNSVELSIEVQPPRRGAVAIALLVTLRPGGADGDEYCEALGPPMKLGEVVAEAQLPLLQLVDARMHGMHQEALWRQLRLPEVNAELGSEMSTAETQLNSAEGLPAGGDVSSVQQLLKSIDCWLPPALQGAPNTELTLLVRNEGGLPAELYVKYPTEMELQIEHWADKGEPTAVELKQHLIVDRGIMEVAPKAASLAPGETATIRVTMRHSRADEYELPLLVQVGSGKQLVLNLRGRTLVPGERHLHLPLRELRLPPTPIGLAQPAVHLLELPNYGDTPLEYELGLDELHALNQASHGFRVLTCEAPAGVIPPRGSAMVAFRFQPLQPRAHAVAIQVHLGGGGRRALVMTLDAYHPSAGAKVAVAHDAALAALLPPSQLLALPAQPLRLSGDRALFGRVPHGCTARQLLLLRNVTDAPCSFEWDASHPRWGTLVSVYPSRGTLGPGEHVCAKVTLLADAATEEVDLALACLLIPHPKQLDPEASSTTGGGGGGGSPDRAPSPAKSLLATSTTGGGGLAPPEPKRASVTEIHPKLRGARALAAIEERRTRGFASRSAGGGGAPSARAAPAAAPSEESPLQPMLQLGIRASVTPRSVLTAAGVPLGSFQLQPDDPQPPLEGAAGAAAAAAMREAAVRPPAPPARGAAPSGVAAGTLELRDAFESLLSGLLGEVLSCRDVGRALEVAPREPVPYFVQIAAAQPRPRAKGHAVAMAGLGGTPPPLWAPPPPPPDEEEDPTARPLVLRDNGQVVASSEEPVRPPLRSQGTQALAVLESKARAEQEGRIREARARQRAEDAARAAVQASTEFQEVVAYVLEGTMFNLVAEVTHGEFSLDAVPRQIVRSLEIEPAEAP